MKAIKPLSSPLRQQGAVLIFSLVMLMLLTLLSVNMIQQNRLQFMMAANAQQQTETFSDAEDLLALEEDQVYIWHANKSQECRNPTTPPSSAYICKNGGNQIVDCYKNDGVTHNPAAKTVTAPVSYANCYSTTTTPYDTDTGTSLDLNVSWTWPENPPANPPANVYRCNKNDEGQYTQLQASDVSADAAPPSLDSPWDITSSLGLEADNIGDDTEVRIVSVACMNDAGIEQACDYDSNGNLSSANLYCNNDPTQTDLTKCTEETANYNCGKTTQSSCPTELYTLQVVSKNANTSAQRTVESKYAVRCDA